MHIFIAAFFLIAPNWKLPTCPAGGEWLNRWGMAIPSNRIQPQIGAGSDACNSLDEASGNCAACKETCRVGEIT